MIDEITYILAGPVAPFIIEVAWAVAISFAAYYVAGLFTKTSSPDNIQMPKLSNYPVQTAARGVPISKVYGTDRVAGNIIYAGPPEPYQVRHEAGETSGGGKGGGSTETQYAYETKYRRSFLIAICEGPAVVLKIWKGKKQISLSHTQTNTEYKDFEPHPSILAPSAGVKTWTTQPITLFDGTDNVGIKDLTGKDFGEYPKLCCAFFEDYDLGNQQAISNFTFEVASGTGLENKILIYDIAGLQAMNDDLTADYALMADIDASGTSSWNGGAGFEPIGKTAGTSFYGTLNGRNHTIAGLFVDRPTTVGCGLFGFVGRDLVSGGHVSNLHLTNCDISCNNTAAMMVGNTRNGSTFTDCSVEGTVTGGSGSTHGGFVAQSIGIDSFTRCGAVGMVTQDGTSNGIYAGGFYAFADGFATFTDCYARVIVNATVMPGANTGCFGGDDDENNTHIRCYAAASIQYSNSEYTYNTSTRPWPYIGGGLIGEPGAGSTFTNCYFDQEEARSIYSDAAKFDSAYKHERQRHNISDDPTGGHFHISHDGNTTGEIAWNANEVTIQAACDAAFGAGEVDIELSASDIWKLNHYIRVMFYGSTYGQSPQADLTFDLAAMAPGGMTVTSNDDVTGAVPLSDANITAKTTAQMGTIATYTDWDFDDVWYMDEDTGYPGLRNHVLSGWDMNPADIIEDIVENDRYGVGDTTIIDDTSLDDCRAYWTAENMLLSITLDQTKPWIDWVDYILSHVSGARFYSGGELKLGVLQNEAAIDAITENELVRNDTENPPPPVSVTKRPRSDTFNRLEVGWVDRDNKYELDFVVVQDRVDQRLNGVRKRVIKLEGIRNRPLALRIAHRILIDGLYRFNVYNFNVSFANSLLENFDVIELSDGEKLSNERIRIMTIEEEVNGRGMSITAMDDLAIHYPDLNDYGSQDNLYEPDPDIILADVTVNFREDTNATKIYLSCTPGNDSFNGGYIYRSYDDVSYSLVGRFGVNGVTGGASNSVGTVDGFLPEHPAITWAMDETILVDIGTVTDLRTDVTEDEFWNDRYLAKIGDEIIAYLDAEETATAGIWQITNLRRGLFGTEPVAHYSGESFCTLMKDFSDTYDPSNIGITLYYKVVSYYGTDFQGIADVSATSVTIQGYYVRPASASLLRLTADENNGGGIEYSGASFTLYWNLGARLSGYGIGGIDVNPAHPIWFYPDSETLLINSGGVLYDNYIQDAELQAVVLKFEQEDGTAIGEREIAVAESVTITKATDLGGYNPAIIKIIPRRAMYAWDENSITVDDGT